MEPLVDAAIEKLKSDHEKSLEKQDQEMRNLLTQVKEIDKEDEVESSRPSPRSNKDWTPEKSAYLEHTRNNLIEKRTPVKPSETARLKGILTGKFLD